MGGWFLVPGGPQPCGGGIRAEAGAGSGRRVDGAAGQPEGVFLREAGWRKGWSLEPGGRPGGREIRALGSVLGYACRLHVPPDRALVLSLTWGRAQKMTAVSVPFYLNLLSSDRAGGPRGHDLPLRRSWRGGCPCRHGWTLSVSASRPWPAYRRMWPRGHSHGGPWERGGIVN